ncbi:hypothetical protein MMC14_010200 [Varicellaria rhodocarpa]|nr:hypothetical protein [Varicellaria rhodocarpa]
MPFSTYVNVFQNSPNHTPLSKSLSSYTVPFANHPGTISSASASKNLELWHHYNTITSLTLSELQPAQNAWQTAVPQLAFSHDFVCHGLLATASIHLAGLQEHSGEREMFLNKAASQLNAGIPHFRNAIRQVTSQNCNALFALSAFVTIFAFVTTRDECNSLLASATIDPDESSPDGGVNQVVVRLLRSVRGALVILKPAWKWIAEGPISAICTRNEWPQHPTPANTRAILEDERLAALSRLWENRENYGTYSEILSDALHELRTTFARASQLTVAVVYGDEGSGNTMLTDRGAAYTWPVHVSEKFLELLEKQLPEALVLMAHYAIVLNRVPDCWWSEGIPAHIVTSAALLLGRERRSWIAWPIRALRPKNIEVM